MILQNPVIPADVPDVDVIRVDDTFYMVSTTMFFMPGAVLLRSKDLAHWEIATYLFDKIADNDFYELKNGKNAYGVGQWATSLAYKDGLFYACFVCHDQKKTYIYYTDQIENRNWNHYEIDEVFHDMSFLFFEGHSYLVYGTGHISIVELKDDLSGVKEGGLRQPLFDTDFEDMGLPCEGCRAYVKDGYIYLNFIEWPKEGKGHGRRREVSYRSKTLTGPYEKKILMDDDCGYLNRGVAQGSLVEAKDGSWYSVLFQDHGAVGRIPYVLPVVWEDNWPVLGIHGKVPKTFELPFEEFKAEPIIISDSFNHDSDELPLQFEWNHNPIPEAWSFTKRPGYLRLTTAQLAQGFMTARNTLTERTNTPYSNFTIEADVSMMKDGDYAGLAAFMSFFGTIGVKKEDGAYYLSLCKKKEDGSQYEEACLALSEKEGFDPSSIFFMVDFNFGDGKEDDLATFYYSLDGHNYEILGQALHMLYTLDVFVGYRIGIFNYATKELGGFVDFRNLEYLDQSVDADC